MEDDIECDFQEEDDYDFGNSDCEYQFSDEEDDLDDDNVAETAKIFPCTNTSNRYGPGIPNKTVSGNKKGPFGLLGLNEDLVFSLEKRLKFRQPSPIQRKAIPQALEGRDILCLARTGSGKTISYLAPIVQKLNCHSTRVGSRCLIILPTRELSLQVTKVLKKLIGKSDLKVACLIGGQGLETQFSVLLKNPDVIIATPGRLAQHLVEKSLELVRVEIFVLDEADKLCEEGFLPHVYKIVSQLPANRQTFVVSATLPTEVAEFTKFNLKDPFLANVGKDHQLSEDLRVDFLYLSSNFKIPALYKIANKLKDKSTIVFMATRHHVEFFKLLFDLSDLKASYVYGSMDMSLRMQQMANFRNSKTNFLFVTDVAARGLDIPIVNNVINFDFPHSPKLFIHRAGRTARAGKTGVAVSLVTLHDLSFASELELFLGTKIEIANQELKSCLLGSIGKLETEVEYVESVIASNAELQRLQRSMDAALELYYKTRPPPSRNSVQKAKKLIASCGGLSSLNHSFHPFWTNPSDTSNASIDILQALNKFRPEKTRLAVGPCKTFEKYQKINNFIQDVRNSQISAGFDQELSDKKSAPNDSDLQDTENTVNNVNSLDKVDRTAIKNISLSKRARKRLENGLELPKRENKRLVKSLIASTTNNEDFVRNSEMKLPDITLDINPDAESDLQRNRYIQKTRWDPKKKKFSQNTVDNLTGKIFKNESGVKVRGEMKSKGLLKKWMASSKMRLQKSGEIEVPRDSNSSKSKKSKLVEIDSSDELSGDKFSQISNPKYAALIDAHRRGQKLTHKETRLIKKITGKFGKGAKSGIKGKGDRTSLELKTPLQMERALKKPTRASRIAKFKKRQSEKMARQSAPSRSIKICRM